MTDKSEAFNDGYGETGDGLGGFPHVYDALRYLGLDGDAGIAPVVDPDTGYTGDVMSDSGLHAGHSRSYDAADAAPAYEPTDNVPFGVEHFDGAAEPDIEDSQRAVDTFVTIQESLLSDPYNQHFIDNPPIVREGTETEVDTVLHLSYNGDDGEADITVSAGRGLAVDFTSNDGSISYNRYFMAYSTAGNCTGIYKDRANRQALLENVPGPGEAPQLERLAAIASIEHSHDTLNATLGLYTPVTDAELRHVMLFVSQAKPPAAPFTALADIAHKRGTSIQPINPADSTFAGTLFSDVIRDFHEYTAEQGELPGSDPDTIHRHYRGEHDTALRISVTYHHHTVDLPAPALHIDMETILSAARMEAELAKRDEHLYNVPEGKWEARLSYLILNGQLFGRLIEQFATQERVVYQSDNSFTADGDDVIMARGVMYNPSFSQADTLHREE